MNTDGAPVAQAFEDAEVVEHYQYRPNYAPQTLAQLTQLCRGTNHALELGCGTGKVTRALAATFQQVVAVDASPEMIRVAQGSAGGRQSNIRWVTDRAEALDFADTKFDLIVAASSIHWMNHEVLFPRLRTYAADEHVFAVIEGDGAHAPPWEVHWHDFLGKWIKHLTAKPYEPHNPNSEFSRYMHRHRAWMRHWQEAHFDMEVSQSVDDFVRCQLSRDTFAPEKLGAELPAFVGELTEILQPFSDNEQLSFTVRTRLEWGHLGQAQERGS